MDLRVRTHWTERFGRNSADLFVRIWNAFWIFGIAITYFPKSQTRAQGVSRRDVLRKIDYPGGVLSITGLVLLCV